ncbi:MAG TPA: DUF11 domain-containing protein, partial [Chloroflexi bacterium]|nr:DUF11 domain-containing protein [Chloroflexota bacterium]
HFPYVGYIDAAGNEVGYSIGPPHVRAYPSWNMLFAVADRPNQPVTYTVDTGSDVLTMTGWCGRTNSCDQMEHVDPLEPGVVITAELEDLTMSMVVADVSLATDTSAETVYGEADIDGQVDVTINQWNSGHYPANGWATTGVLASSPFTATFDGFDVRDAMILFAYHYDAVDGNRTLVAPGNFETAHFRVYPQYNAVGVAPPAADAPVTARLYDADGATLLDTTSTDHNDNPWWFWLNFDTGIEVGHWITVTSGSWEAGLQVPELTLEWDLDSDTIWGEAPKALVWVEIWNFSNWLGRFVPSDGYLLDTAAQYGWDLQWGDYMAATYQAPNGDLVQVEFNWPQIVANYAMDGSNQVWGGGAIPGNILYITITDASDQVIATGSTQPGSGWHGPQSYQLNFPDGTILPGYTVTVDFGEELVDAVEVVAITAYPDIVSDVVTGTAPANSFLHINVDCWNDGCWNALYNVPVDASGVFTADFSTVGHDIYYGDSFNIHHSNERGHQTQYSFWVPMPDLQIEKQQTPGHARPGGTYLYRIRYWNHGNGDAENVVITDSLPLSTIYFADTSGFSAIDGGSVITWELGTVPPYSYQEFYVALEVDAGVPTQTQLNDNCVGIATTSPGDPDPGNNWHCTAARGWMIATWVWA